jgi:hypothetical protein
MQISGNLTPWFYSDRTRVRSELGQGFYMLSLQLNIIKKFPGFFSSLEEKNLC